MSRSHKVFDLWAQGRRFFSPPALFYCVSEERPERVYEKAPVGIARNERG
jgi:hypothetical protein